LLFESCPDSLVTDFVKKRRKKYDNRRTRSLFSRKKKDETWEGYLPIGIVLDIFRQMADAVSVLHSIQEDSDSGNRSQFSGSVSERFRKGLTHLDIQPSRFVIRRIKEKGEDGERHEVTLATFGALVHGSMSLNKDVERDVATRIINSSSNPLYRSPEMINLHMWDEITGRYVKQSANQQFKGSDFSRAFF
jgi:serine/threonine protein kinase